MKFRGLRRRAPCRRLSGWIAQHRDRSGSPGQLLWDLGFCRHMCTVCHSFVYSRRARGCHRGVTMGVKVWDKRRKAVGEDGKGVSSSCTDCSCKSAEKKTVLVEIDTWTRKQNANEKNNPCRSSKKVLSKRIPNPLKLSIQGRCAKRGWGTGDNLDVPDHPWETARARCRRRKAGLLVAEFCAHISMRAPQWSMNTTQSFQRGKSFPIASYPISFLPPLWLESMVRVLSNHGW